MTALCLAQPCDDTDVLHPGSDCQSAPILCEFDGYCFQTELTSNTSAPNQFCGTPHNVQWVAFVAATSDITIEMYVSNCTDDVGLQAHIYETTNCIWFTPVSNCIYIVEEGQTAVINATNMTPGQTYYMLIDGGYGDICDYQLTITSGAMQGGQPVAEAVEEYFICPGEEITLDASGSSIGTNFSYEWTTQDGVIESGQNTLSPVVSGEGLYELTVFNDVGCFEQTEVEVNFLPIGVADADPEEDINCYQPIIELGGTNISSGTIYEYNWTTTNGNFIGQTNLPHPQIDQGGTYFLEMRHVVSGCVTYDTVTIIEDLELPFASGGPDVYIDCNNPIAILDGSLSTGTHQLSYEWSTVDGEVSIGNGQYLPQLSVEEGGTYTLTVIDEVNGCRSTDDVFVDADKTVPIADLALSGTIDCNNEEISFIDNGSSLGTHISYFWTSDDGTIVTDPNQLIATISSGGTYELEITNSQNGCTNTYEYEVLASQIRPRGIIEIDQHLGCEVSVGIIDASASTQNANMTYTWSTTNGNILHIERDLLVQVDQPGIYTLILHDELSGCSDTVDAEVLQHIDGPSTAEIIPVQPPCSYSLGGSILIDNIVGGIPPYAYGLKEPDTDNYLVYEDNIPPGVYTVEIKDAFGCVYTSDVEIFAKDEIIVELENDIIMELGDEEEIGITTSLSPAEIDTIIWEPAEFMACQNCLNQTISPDISTQIKVSIIDEFGCIAIDTMHVTVEKIRYLYIPNIFSPNDDSHNDMFLIHGGKGIKEIKSLIIVDRWGNTPVEYKNFQPNDPSYGWDGKLDGKPMAIGVYAYHIEIEFVGGLVESFTGDITLIR